MVYAEGIHADPPERNFKAMGQKAETDWCEVCSYEEYEDNIHVVDTDDMGVLVKVCEECLQEFYTYDEFTDMYRSKEQ